MTDFTPEIAEAFAIKAGLEDFTMARPMPSNFLVMVPPMAATEASIPEGKLVGEFEIKMKLPETLMSGDGRADALPFVSGFLSCDVMVRSQE